MDDNEKVEESKDLLAARRAWLDQRKTQFEKQYDFWPARINRNRLYDLEVWEFQLEMHEWELEQGVAPIIEEED